MSEPNIEPLVTPDMDPQFSPQPKKKFYQKTWFIILLLIIFWPVGLFLMWKFADWSKNAKIIITILIGIFLIIGIAAP